MGQGIKQNISPKKTYRWLTNAWKDAQYHSLSVQFSSVAQSSPTLCDPMNRSTPGLPVHHHLPEFIQTHVLWVGDVPPPRIMGIKTKINKCNLIKRKSFCTAKETINKVKRQLSEWEKIITNKTTDKGLISKIHKHLIQLITRKINNPVKKLSKRPK